MTEPEALRLVSDLIAATNGWDDAGVIWWTEHIADLADPAAARHATALIVKTWKYSTRPTWGAFMEIYEAQPPSQRAITAGPRWTGKEISIGQYLDELRNYKDPAAKEELAMWERHIRTSSVWTSFITGGRTNP